MGNPIDTDDFDNLLIDGVGELLAAAGIGVYSLTTAYTPTDTAITVQTLPDSPDNALALSTYAISDDPSLSTSVVGLQVFSRAAGEATRATNKLAGQVFNQLHGLRNITLPSGVRVTFAERKSSSLLGQDDLNRWERVDNYYLTVWRPSQNRT